MSQIAQPFRKAGPVSGGGHGPCVGSPKERRECESGDGKKRCDLTAPLGSESVDFLSRRGKPDDQQGNDNGNESAADPHHEMVMEYVCGQQRHDCDGGQEPCGDSSILCASDQNEDSGKRTE